MTQMGAVVFVGLLLGLGWSVRGHFGHEYGAAWAGALGAMALVAVSGRSDWRSRLPVPVALAALGWAAGGMMSYGRIVGFGRDTDFWNVSYGLAMLAVVGALHGFMGGGLLGLTLETTGDKRPDWAALFSQMVAGALLFWGILIYQFEWKMTPPRSELWAACLGVSAALAWFLQRNGYHRALRVAGWSALGAGFGFAFGNFLQTMGFVSGVTFNWWNVMEFSLGCGGGLGMAWGVFSRDWPESARSPAAVTRAALVFLVAAIPLLNLANAFEAERLVGDAQRAAHPDPARFASSTLLVAAIAVLSFSTVAVVTWVKTRSAPALLFLFAAYYVVFGHIRKGMLTGGRIWQPEQFLYWVVLGAAAALFFLKRGKPPGPFREAAPESWRAWLLRVAILLGAVALLAFVSISSHEGLPGAQRRFQP